MRDIHVDQLIGVVRQLCREANFRLRNDTISAYHRALRDEASPVGRRVLAQLLENADYAREHHVPICQDTGSAVLFVELGQEVHILGGPLNAALNEGVRQGYREGYLRKSLVKNAIERINTGDNTPAAINVDIVDGDQVKIRLLVKGAGCDNVSALRMFTPADGLNAAEDFIVHVVEKAGPNARPPVVIGVGMGGPQSMIFPRSS